jgi:hypothetical protein
MLDDTKSAGELISSETTEANVTPSQEAHGVASELPEEKSEESHGALNTGVLQDSEEAFSEATRICTFKGIIILLSF